MGGFPRDYYERVLAQQRKVARRGPPRLRRVRVKAGLTEQEFQEIEARYEVRFPPDLRSLLSVGVPVARLKNGLLLWPDWATDNEHDRAWIKSSLTRPVDAILARVERGEWWWTAWGERPASRSTGLRIAETRLREAPRLIWLGGHLFMPFEPDGVGNPLVWIFDGTEAQIVARDLAVLHWHEYGIEPLPPRELPERRPSMWDEGRAEEAAAARWIPFWSELAAWNVKVGVPYTPTEPEVLRFFTWEEP